jgi:hypothetical protein
LIDFYAKETGRSVITNASAGMSIKTNEVFSSIPSFPPNIFKNTVKGMIRFSSKAVWDLSVGRDGDYPCITIDFTDSNGENSGKLQIYVWRNDAAKGLKAHHKSSGATKCKRQLQSGAGGGPTL